MRRLGIAITAALSTLASLAFAGQVYAANVSVRVEQPKTPTNQNDFPVTFVAMDLLGRDMTAQCFKKSPSDGGFTQFGSNIALTSGGNSGTCSVNSSIVGEQGTYEFMVKATAGGDEDTETVSVVYDTSGPGDVRDYSKSKINSCEYSIHFRTAEDAGQTVKVEVYRSENTTFNTDSGTRVGTVSVGSNETRDFVNAVPDCNKTYYYAIRAFDASGNGSAVVGDTGITTTTTTTTQAAAAIPVAGTGGNILGTEDTAGQAGEEAAGDTLGETSPSAEVVDLESEGGMSTLGRNLFLGGGILALGALLYALYKRQKQTGTPQV
jgi:hypothetical protein